MDSIDYEALALQTEHTPDFVRLFDQMTGELIIARLIHAFSSERALKRDLASERAVLEGEEREAELQAEEAADDIGATYFDR